MKITSIKILSNSGLRLLISVALLVNMIGFLAPTFGSNDAVFYAIIAKNIVISHDWIDLTFGGHPWLDKPHFPFWVTALSFKLFGIRVFSYVLPGFLFSLLGAIYTYKLTKYLYSNKEVAILAMLFYVTALHLMTSAIDIRAEAFLLGTVIPACYYWIIYNNWFFSTPSSQYTKVRSILGYQYDLCPISNLINNASIKPTSDAIKCKFTWKSINLRALMLASAFSGCAIMTKGIFVVIILFSGIWGIWVYNKSFKSNLLSIKWLLAFGLTGICILPELICLFLQFDLPNKVFIFGKYQHYSGLRFFFFDSQFGRFFDNGPITNNISSGIGHYFYFFHTFLWSFLPWTLFFLIALYYGFKSFCFGKDLPGYRLNQTRCIYLLASFLPMFIVFSITKFQLDYYINILLPFAAIISAEWFYKVATRLSNHWVLMFQIIISFLILLLILLLAIIIFNGHLFMFMILLIIFTFVVFLLLSQNYMTTKAIIFPFIVVNLMFIMYLLIQNRLYLRFDAGYQIAKYVNQQPDSLAILDYHIYLNPLYFGINNNHKYYRISGVDEVKRVLPPFYLVGLKSDVNKEIKPQLQSYTILGDFEYLPRNLFPLTLLSIKRRIQLTQDIVLIRVNAFNQLSKNSPISNSNTAIIPDGELEKNL